VNRSGRLADAAFLIQNRDYHTGLSCSFEAAKAQKRETGES
jgi:hypothetical protein